MRFNISLRTRLTISIIILLMAQVIFVLFVIQRQEIKAIYKEQRDKGELLTKNIIQENLRPFILWDDDGVKKNIEDRIDEKLIYVVFFSRYNRPFVANDFILDFEDIYQYSNLDPDSQVKDSYFKSKELVDKDKNTVMNVLEIEMPIFAKGDPKRWGSVKIGLSLEDMKAEERNTLLLLILIGLGGLLVGVLAATWLARRITTPLQKLVEGTKKISRGDFSLQIDIDSKDEIGSLAQSFNEMSYQLQLLKERMEEANKKLVQVEKLASIGHISAGIAHEIRNPLTSVKLNIQKLLEKESLDESEQAHLDISQEGIAQIEKFVKELLNFARVSELNLDWFSIEQIVDGSVKMIADSLELKKVSLEKHYQEELPLMKVDADKIRQVILNILRNAWEAVEEGGKISIHLSQDSSHQEKYTKILIFDDGNGIPEKEWENVFEPFYTTKSSGIGLGLAIARKIIEQHDGSIEIKSTGGGGTSFVILLPVRRDQ